MHTLGHAFMPPAIHAGGLRYHGMSPLVSRVYLDGLIEAQAYKQLEVFEAALFFARTEGLIPAPESAHAIKAAIEEAKKAKIEGTKKIILFNLSGHGHFDMASYDAYLDGKLEDYEMPAEDINAALAELETYPVIKN
jgi:tryptophan synthase beta chain